MSKFNDYLILRDAYEIIIDQSLKDKLEVYMNSQYVDMEYLIHMKLDEALELFHDYLLSVRKDKLRTSKLSDNNLNEIDELLSRIYSLRKELSS